MIAVLSASLNRLHMVRLHFIVESTSRRLQTISRTVNRLKRQGKRGRFWQRPGRTSAWWSSFVKTRVVPGEWKENFRMSMQTFMEWEFALVYGGFGAILLIALRMA